MHWLYLAINIGSIALPLVYSFHHSIKFNRHFKALFAALAITAFCFVTWDMIFTQAGVWGFSNNYTFGIRIGQLPLEEVLFFFCIPFSSIFIYHCINLFYPKTISGKTVNVITVVLILFLSVTGFIFIGRLYTSVTFLSTAVLLTLFQFVLKIKWLGNYYRAYIIILIPFFIVNGILTGTGLESPVVWYNNNENMGIRLLTIPFEDVFYGFELLLLNIFIFEKLKPFLSERLENRQPFFI